MRPISARGDGIELRIGRQSALGPIEAWLTRIREFRGKIMYDNGRRPYFCDDVGRYIDAEEIDFGSWHISAHLGSDTRIAACVRLVPPELSSLFKSRRYLGPRWREETIAAMAPDNESIFEVGRLLLSGRVHDGELADTLLAAAIAVGRVFDAGLLVGVAFADSGWHRRTGWVEHPEADRYSSFYGETMRLVSRAPRGGTPEYERLVTDLQRRVEEILPEDSGLAVLRL
ncbi:hypothetical protein FHS43_004477 [Streptosporangium becharense]|uniref:Uncharacterized protein n=1 Tax=Streptosporangium becharense TaxID=1816182 RepID=A0A7W9MIF5_9ACTN|nr:hypothetical protein [Streptosporangium becharense]MBB2913179.1 hypothetical protein [Streptosporangium becharense]MBB5822162.1 hypothetical protein [Streptosporangium becharense]